MYQGDYAASSLVVFNFNTAAFSDGSPITLAGTPALSVYKNSTTESTAGVTLTVDYDSRTGMHHVAIDTSASGAFYAAGNDFDVILTAGTVGGTSVVGRKVGAFSIANRALPAAPTNWLDANSVKADAVTKIQAGIMTSAGYTAPDNTSVAAIKAKTDNLPAAPASTTNITAGTIANLTNLPAAPTDWLTAAAVKADAVTKIQAGLSTFAGGAVASVTGSVGGIVGVTFPSVVGDATDAHVLAIKAKTDNLPASPADETLVINATNAILTAVNAVPTANANADALLKRDWTALSGESLHSVLNALRSLSYFTVSGTTLTVYKEDHVTVAYTRTLTTDPAAVPITGAVS